MVRRALLYAAGAEGAASPDRPCSVTGASGDTCIADATAVRLRAAHAAVLFAPGLARVARPSEVGSACRLPGRPCAAAPPSARRLSPSAWAEAAKLRLARGRAPTDERQTLHGGPCKCFRSAQLRSEPQPLRAR